MKSYALRGPMARALGRISVLAIVVSGCASEPTSTPDDIQRAAEAQFHRAVALLNEGNLVESWRAVREMNGLVDAFLEPASPMGRREASGAEGTIAMGRPLREWQEEWNHRYGLSLQTAWPTIRQAIEDESIELPLLKGYVDTFLGREYVKRVNAEYRRLEPVFRARRAKQYWYSCEGGGDLCDVVRDAVIAKMPPGAVTTSWTGDIEDYRGSVDVEIQVLTEVTYRRGSESRGLLPQSALVTVSVSTRGGSSPWDGVSRFELEGELPSSIAPHELPRVTQRHWENLRRDLDSEMAAWPATD